MQYSIHLIMATDIDEIDLFVGDNNIDDDSIFHSYRDTIESIQLSLEFMEPEAWMVGIIL